MIRIEEIKFVIDNIPNLLTYFIYGYIFLSAFEWSSFNTPSSEFNVSIIKSVVINFVLLNFYDIIFSGLKQFNLFPNIVILSIISLVLGLYMGVIYKSHGFNWLLGKIKINRTTNECIWEDVLQKGTWVKIFMEDNTSYIGQATFSEPFNNEPIIVLQGYQQLDENENIIKDYTENPNRLMMLNTKDFKKIEILYT